MSQMIDACAVGAPLPGLWHSNAAPGATAAGSAIPDPVDRRGSALFGNIRRIFAEMDVRT
jgi:hypothetical protein